MSRTTQFTRGKEILTFFTLLIVGIYFFYKWDHLRKWVFDSNHDQYFTCFDMHTIG